MCGSNGWPHRLQFPSSSSRLSGGTGTIYHPSEVSGFRTSFLPFDSLRVIAAQRIDLLVVARRVMVVPADRAEDPHHEEGSNEESRTRTGRRSARRRRHYRRLSAEEGHTRRREGQGDRDREEDGRGFILGCHG